MKLQILFMAIFMKGVAYEYTTIDSSQPIERIKLILSQIQPVLVIKIHGNLPDGLELVNIPLLEYDILLLTLIIIEWESTVIQCFIHL